MGSTSSSRTQTSCSRSARKRAKITWRSCIRQLRCGWGRRPEPHDKPAGERVVDQEAVDRLLRQAVTARQFAGEDPERRDGSFVEESGAHEVVVDDHLRAPQPAEPAHGDELRIAGAGAD